MIKDTLLLFLLTFTFLTSTYSQTVFAQQCTQLNLPENAITRFCTQDNQYFLDLDFSPDGKTLASVVNWVRKLVLWDVENKTEKLTINDVNGRYVRYSPDGKTLVCGDVVYDATTGEPTLLLLDGEGYRDYVIYSPDGATIAGLGPKGIRFWKSKIDEPTTEALPVGDLPINVLPTDTSADTNNTSPTSTPIATSSTTLTGIRGLSYSPDGKELAVASRLGVWVYNTELNTEVALLKEGDGQIFSVSYSPDGNILAASVQRYIYLYDIKTKNLKYKFPRQFWLISSLVFQNNKILISGSASGIHFLDITTFEYKRVLSTENTHYNMMSPNGNILASARYDNTVLLYDLTSYPVVSLSPDSVTSLTVGEELAFDLKITNGKNVSGYQATIEYDPDALEYVETQYGTYLSGGVPVQPISNQHAGTVQLASLSLSGTESSGDGTLATIKFKVKAIRTSKLGLRDVILSDPEGNKSYAWIEGAQILKTIITEDGESITCSTVISEDVNKDCTVNIQDLVLVATNFGKGGGNASDVNFDGRVDIIDLVLVAGAFGETADTAEAPAVYGDAQDIIDAADVRQWLKLAKQVNLPDTTFQRGIATLEHLARALSPKETALLPNYPNPFNPETWIPYQLAESADVSISIYSADGKTVRTLQLGNMQAGDYQNRNRAAYWDGKNAVGESVATGVYFYTLTAGDFTATRKMLIMK